MKTPLTNYMSIMIYIQLPNQNHYCEIVVISILPLSVFWEEKKKTNLLGINSFSNSLSPHSCVSKAPTMQAAKIVQ